MDIGNIIVCVLIGFAIIVFATIVIGMRSRSKPVRLPSLCKVTIIHVEKVDEKDVYEDEITGFHVETIIEVIELLTPNEGLVPGMRFYRELENKVGDVGHEFVTDVSLWQMM